MYLPTPCNINMSVICSTAHKKIGKPHCSMSKHCLPKLQHASPDLSSAPTYTTLAASHLRCSQHR